MRIVAKALEDFNGYWHWVELHNAELVDAENRVYRIDGADTICGIHLSGPNTARLHDTGAPSEPDCEACLEGGDLDLSAIMDQAERLTAPTHAVAAPPSRTR